MKTSEFSNEFDVLYNSITSNKAPGLDEYEKSIFLTKAQDDLIKDYFNPRTVKTGEGFDDSQKRQYDFSSLIKSITLQNIDDTLYAILANGKITYSKFDSRAKVFIAPRDMYLIINESINTTNTRYSVLPISYSEYARLMLKPYGYPLKKQAWRLITDNSKGLDGWGGYYNGTDITRVRNYLIKAKGKWDVSITFWYTTNSSAPKITVTGNTVKIMCLIASDKISNYWSVYLANKEVLKSCGLDEYIYPITDTTGYFPSVTYDTKVDIFVPSPLNKGPLLEVIGKFDNDKITYNMRYVRNPKPIILTTLDTDLSIKGESEISECELPENTHQEILQRAVELAKASYTGDLNSMIQLGTASSTDIGIVPQQTNR